LQKYCAFQCIVKTKKLGIAIAIPNFGTFEIKKRLERVLVSPTTGQRMLVPPKMVVGFKQSNVLKNKIQ
jgi:DNA-binding protein HU-beta/integration host factor subunit alpha